MINVFNCAQSQPVQKQKGEPSLKLLIVEDVLADVELMVIALETAEIQFTYDAVDNLIHCEQLLQTKQYDAVLADYRLPQFTAYQVLQLLQQSTQEIPLILVTGSLGEEAAVECIKAGMTDYVLKERLFRLPMVLQRSLAEFALRRQQQASIVCIQQQAQQQAIINSIVQAMRETLILDEVLKSTVDALHDALNPSRCFISQPDAQQEMWVNHVSAATLNREDCIGVKCFIYPHYQEAFQQGEIIIISRTDSHIPVALQELVRNWSLNSVLIAPLLYQQTLLGGIVLHQCDRDRVWNSDEISLLQAISNQCAIAIHQAQLFHQLQQQTQWEKTLNQISRSINSSLDPEYILQEIVRLTGECFAVDRVMIYAVENQQIKITREWRSSAEICSLLGYTTPLAEWIAAIDFSPYKVFYAPHMEKIRATSKEVDIVKTVPHLTVLSVPIFIRDEFFGGLAVHAMTRVHFSEEEISLLQRIADKAAIALYNAQSYELLEELVKKRTQELEAEKLLSDAANRAKSEFLSNMSHELRTPLTGILGFSSILIEEIFGSLNAKQKQYIAGIHTCGKHLLELINDLLDLTKIEAGKEELALEEIQVLKVCQDCLALFTENQLPELQLKFAIASDIHTCIADQRRLKQILVNLLSNAFKFTEVGSITLKVEQTEVAILFSVIDTGIGISPPDQETLFQPFQQLDSGLDRKYEGTGLGLALSRKLARLHGGDITVQSQLGSGSCFTLILPHSPQIN
ncbi:GAF domain-containing protein [Gloeocapsopsis crepidinum LEGE 06123]|uniref:histidine kinase n=1 Tax=Gloeocapsopsis crepidinum LEGE 06123 TaxID=588587 RepID=A0ABR9UWE4_9CHRO|nr:GAF domain-containing protein [Gloeocapsopsis crepidinum]MBE9192617.1 GAF domain-containing protein [Gloeocapsopsis crepidinum LEGE 06123]